MAAPGKHEKREPGPACQQCGSTDTAVHCPGPQCTWIKCNVCHRLSDTRKARKQGDP